MKTLTANELDEIIGTDGLYYTIMLDLKDGDTIYVATLPHKSGNAQRGCYLITNSEEEFSYWNNQANSSHYLYRVQKYLYNGEYKLSEGQLECIKEAYDWATRKMLDNTVNGIWNHWDHFISGLSMNLDDDDDEFYEAICKAYDALDEVA